jgi:hypothetical protein
MIFMWSAGAGEVETVIRDIIYDERARRSSYVSFYTCISSARDLTKRGHRRQTRPVQPPHVAVAGVGDRVLNQSQSLPWHPPSPLSSARFRLRCVYLALARHKVTALLQPNTVPGKEPDTLKEAENFAFI